MLRYLEMSRYLEMPRYLEKMVASIWEKINGRN